MRKEGNFQILIKKRTQFIPVMLACICAISDGMQYAWTAPSIPILESEESPVEVDSDDEIWLENIYNFGGLAGLAVTIWFVNRFGRKKSILFAAVQHAIAWIMIALAKDKAVIYVARFISGLAGDVSFVSIPMYIAEVADKQIRGFLGTFIFINMMIGVLVLYCVAPYTTIANCSYVGLSIVLFQICTFIWMPETPYYYLINGKQYKALKSLQWIRNTKDVKDELEDISKAVKRQQSEEGRVKDLFTVKSNLRCVIIMTVLNAAQQFSSFSVLLMNMHTILEDSASFLSNNIASIIAAALMLVACISASLIIDKFGRKRLLIISSSTTSIALGILATYFAIKNSGYAIEYSYGWVPLASVIMYSFTFKVGLGLVPIVMTGELFPTNIKAMGMTLADAMYVGFSIISIYIFMTTRYWLGMHVPFYIFSGSCILTTFFTLWYIPETKGKTLEEIQLMLRGIDN
ncbi:facilitated trehalose transporter Tret1-like [Agrilus planipennis]|uniref:Facilitated trehalose transporter Tret1-like n=1 Tax=Agrilus planipennis TaxID=224129 RepID=A0A1W4XNQ9_AGRPL|nr:facilitated trehalose transporter Tret1-like [Agrilus planipennis]